MDWPFKFDGLAAVATFGAAIDDWVFDVTVNSDFGSDGLDASMAALVFSVISTPDFSSSFGLLVDGSIAIVTDESPVGLVGISSESVALNGARFDKSDELVVVAFVVPLAGEGLGEFEDGGEEDGVVARAVVDEGLGAGCGIAVPTGGGALCELGSPAELFGPASDASEEAPSDWLDWECEREDDVFAIGCEGGIDKFA